MNTRLPLKPLKFIHITKNAGSSIEDSAKKYSIYWGRWDTNYCPLGCFLGSGGWWHKIFSKTPEKLQSRFDWFLVCRNPYDRIISEFYCIWGEGWIEKPYFMNGVITTTKPTKEQFNKFLISQINKRSREGDHYTEQYLYLSNDPYIKVNIIHYENLKEEFQKLMKLYSLNVKLDLHINSGVSEYFGEKFTVKDFSPELIQLINTVYKKDFEIFGYKMINLP
jgi:hypothetical protein